METSRQSFDGLEVVSYDSPLSAFAANAHLILGKKEAILIDAMLLLSEGRKLAGAIRESGRELTTIFVTHNHPDHYWGLEPIVKAFPNARVVASKDVAFHIKYTSRAKVVHWKPIYGDDISFHPIAPEALGSSEIKLEGHTFRIVDLPPAETIFAGAVYSPSIEAVFTGDLIFNNFHFYMADVNVPESWIDAIEVVKAQGPVERVYPGHGPNGDGRTLDKVIRYLRDYAEASKPPASKEQMIERMKQLYPDWRMPEILCCTLGPSLSSDEFKVLKTMS